MRVVCPSGTIADLCVSVRAAPARAVVRPPCHLLLTKSPRMVSHESICPQWALRSASRPAPAPHAASTPSASCCAPSFEAARPCRRAALLEPGHNGGACGSSGRNRRFGIAETRRAWFHGRCVSLAPPAQKLCKRAAAENVLGINDARAWFRCRCARVLYINGIRNANLYFDIHRVYTSRECLVY